MQTSPDLATKDRQGWVYASITVRDGQRRLKPAQVAYDRLLFATPPRLANEQVEIILVNGDAEQRHTARVLPHDPETMRVPIQLLSMD